MPRATPVPDNEETSTAPKRARRAPRKKALVTEEVPTVSDEAVSSPAPVRRKAPTRRVVAPAAAVERVSELSNAATVSAGPRPRRGGRLQIAVVLGVLVIGIGASAAIGLSDTGKIDVAARIQAQSQLVANQNGGEGGTTQTIPVQNTPVNVPNGGLIPAGAATPAPPPPPEPATTTASTTNETVGTSTETVAEEVVADTTAEEVGDSAPETTAEPVLAQ